MRSPRGYPTTGALGSQGVLETYSFPIQPLEVGFPSQDFGSRISGSWGEALPHWGASDRDLAPGLWGGAWAPMDTPSLMCPHLYALWAKSVDDGDWEEGALGT